MAVLRKYPDELRQRAIRLVRDADTEPDRSRKAACRRVGQQLGISPETLRGWVNRDEIDAGERPGIPTETATRVAELEWRSGAATGERDPEVGIGFLRGGARPPRPLDLDYIDRTRRSSGSSRSVRC